MKIITTVKLRALVGNRKVNQFMRHFDLFQEKEGVGVEENMVVTFKEGEIVDEQRVYDLVRNFKAEADKATDTSFDILHVEFAGGTHLHFHDESGEEVLVSNDKEALKRYEYFCTQKKVLNTIDEDG